MVLILVNVRFLETCRLILMRAGPEMFYLCLADILAYSRYSVKKKEQESRKK